jgi:hypothetical protein
MIPSMSRKGNCYDNAPMRRWRVSGERSKMSSCIIVATRLVNKLGARSRSTARSSITVSGGILGSGIARPLRLSSNGSVNHRQSEAAIHGVHS